VKRNLPGLSQGSRLSEVPDGFYLVRVRRVQNRWERQKPFYAVQFVIVEPKEFANSSISARIYCTKKALWKLTWFLRDFGYDSNLIENDELEESVLLKLQGVVKISHAILHGTSLLNLDGFAPAKQWPNFSDSATSSHSELAS
jgi:hypothetical protein